MKTEHLIGGLVADSGQRPPSVRQTLLYVLPVGLIAGICVFSGILDMRADFLNAITTWRYLLKIAVGGAIAVIGTWLLLRAANPQHPPKADIKLALIALLPLCAGLASEMIFLPVDRWATSAIGVRPLSCLVFIPLIAVAPLAASLATLRKGAPRSPTTAGAVAGFAAGGMAALIYAFHCNNDSPFYVAIWYLMAIGIVTLAGAVIGRAWLRW